MLNPGHDKSRPGLERATRIESLEAARDWTQRWGALCGRWNRRASVVEDPQEALAQDHLEVRRFCRRCEFSLDEAELELIADSLSFDHPVYGDLPLQGDHLDAYDYAPLVLGAGNPLLVEASGLHEPEEFNLRSAHLIAPSVGWRVQLYIDPSRSEKDCQVALFLLS